MKFLKKVMASNVEQAFKWATSNGDEYGYPIDKAAKKFHLSEEASEELQDKLEVFLKRHNPKHDSLSSKAK